jgi:hypothetical protein
MDELKKAFDLLEGNGFHVSRAYEETRKDAGIESSDGSKLTGAIWLRAVPVETDEPR